MVTSNQLAARSSRKMICSFLDRLKTDGKWRAASSSRIARACGVSGLGDLLKSMVSEGLIEACRTVDGTEYMSIDGWAVKLDRQYARRPTIVLDWTK